MPKVSVIMPVYNVEKYIKRALLSVMHQSYSDFELIIINDGSTDDSVSLCRELEMPNMRIIDQDNQGLAAARNTGIRHANGEYIAFIDSDDLWHSEKLNMHVYHLENNPSVGVSYSSSHFIDGDGKKMEAGQYPKLNNITPDWILCRNPIGNGSAPVIRASVFNDISFYQNNNALQQEFFDSTFKQSEDIECWMRIALTTTWKFEGVDFPLTYYRLNQNGLSSNIEKQFYYWKKMMRKLKKINPSFIKKHGRKALAYQFRYYSRRAIHSRNAHDARKYLILSYLANIGIIWEDPKRTLSTTAASFLLSIAPGMYKNLEKIAIRMNSH